MLYQAPIPDNPSHFVEQELHRLTNRLHRTLHSFYLVIELFLLKWSATSFNADKSRDKYRIAWPAPKQWLHASATLTMCVMPNSSYASSLFA
eukprot:1187746-Prorocentrum_minimum.AAC.6